MDLEQINLISFENNLNLSPQRKSDQSFEIKDELLDITEGDDKTDIKIEPCCSEECELTIHESSAGKNTYDVFKRTASMDDDITEIMDAINTSDKTSKTIYTVSNLETPVTRKVIIDGQKKTCFLVKNPGLQRNIQESVEKIQNTSGSSSTPTKPSTGKPTLKLMVQCLRCRSKVHIDSFRQHIEACPPRKPHSKQNYSQKNNLTPRVNENQTIQVMYNAFTGQVMTLNENRNRSDCHVSVSDSDNCLDNSGCDNSQEIQRNTRDLSSNRGTCPRNDQKSKTNSQNLTLVQNSIDFETPSVDYQPSIDHTYSKSPTFYDEVNGVSTSLSPKNDLPETYSNSQANPQKSSNNNKQARYSCDLCSYKAYTKNDLVKHRNCHEKNAPINMCPKCDYRATPLALKAHIKRHLDLSLADIHSSPNQNIDSAQAKPNNKIISNTHSSTTITEKSSKNSESNSALVSNFYIMLIEEPWAMQGASISESLNQSAVDPERVIRNEDTISINKGTRSHLTSPMRSRSKSLSLRTYERKRRTATDENLNNKFVGTPTVLLKARSESDLLEFRGFDRKPLDDKINAVIKKLCEEVRAKEKKILKPSNNSTCAERTTPTREDIDTGQPRLTPGRTRSKSVCAERFIEKSGDDFDLSFLRMRTRSKSISSRKVVVTEFRGFDRESLDDTVNAVIKKLSEEVRAKKKEILKPSNNSTCAEITTSTRENNDTGQPSLSPRRTRSKSVCAGRFIEKSNDDFDLSYMGMRTRSKSISSRKVESTKSMAPETAPRVSRSRSVHRDKNDPRKRAQSVPRLSDGVKRSKNGDTTYKNREDIHYSRKDPVNAESAKKSVQNIRSKSVVEENKSIHPITYYQNLLKSRSKSVDRSKFLSKSNSLASDSNITICEDVGDISTKVSETNYHDTRDISNNSCESATDNQHVISTDRLSQTVQESEDILDDSLLLEDNTFSCSVCSFTTDKKRILNDHERNHRKTKLPIVQCFYCSQRYTRYMLYLHIQNVHPGQKFQIRSETLLTCSTNPFSTKNQKQLNKDVERTSSELDNETREAYLKCSTCSFTTTEQAVLESHKKKHVSGAPKPTNQFSEREFKCSLCSFSAREQLALKVHLKKHVFEAVRRTDASGNKMFHCNLCSYTRSDSYKVIRHMSSHKNNKPISKCNNCCFKSTLLALKAHMKKCGKKVKQTIVNKSEQSSENTNKSKPDQVKPRPFLKCSTCSFSTADLDKLKLHEKKHILEPVKHTDSYGRSRYSCRMCSYQCRYFRPMIIHIDTHRSNPPIIKCSKCTFKSTSRILKIHVEKCRANSKLTNSPDNTSSSKSSEIPKKHSLESVREIDASGHAIYNCRMCSYETKHTGDMNKHFKVHRKNIPMVQCPNCDFKSTLRVVLFHKRKCRANPKLANRKNSEQHKLKRNAKKHLPELVQVSEKFGRKIYSCRMCSYESSNYSDLGIHINLHRKNVPIIKCPNCDFKSTMRALQSHKRKCKANHESTSAANKVLAVAASVSETEPRSLFNCTVCSFSTHLRIRLKIHMRKCHLVTETVFKCKLCSYVSTKKMYFDQHSISHRNNLPMKTCLYCGFKSTLNIFRKHILKCGPTKKPGTSVCPAKSKVSTVGIVRKPMLKCGPNEKHRATSGRSTKTKKSTVRLITKEMLKSALNENLKATSDSVTKDYRCKLCSFVTDRSSAYISHMKSHARKQAIKKCPKCDYTSTLNALKHHICNTNTLNISKKNKSKKAEKNNAKTDASSKDSKPTNLNNNKSMFKCSQCPFSTYLRIQLKSHVKKYHLKSSTTSQKNYKCSYCSYVTITVQNYQRHLRTHTQWKLPIEKCKNCDFRSTNLALRKHALKCKESPVKENTSDGSNKELNDFSDIEALQSPSTTSTRGDEGPPMSESMNSFKNDSDKRNSTSKSNSKKSFSPIAASLASENTNNKFENLSDVKNRKMMHKCTTCSYSSSDSYALKRHLDTHKSNLGQSTVQILNNQYQRKPRTSLKNSQKRAEPDNNIVQKNNDNISASSSEAIMNCSGLYKCDSCSYTATRKSNLTRHQEGHRLNLSIHQCPNCCYRATSQALYYHLRKCTGTTDQTKDLELNSNASERSDTSLKRKLGYRDVPKVPVEQCVRCDFKGTQLLLKKHEPNCPNKVLLNCSACSYSTNIPKNLKDHEEKSHPKRREAKDLNLKNFKCSFCSFTSFWSYLIERHMNSHTLLNLPIKQCTKCDFRSTPAALTAHTKACTGRSQKRSSDLSANVSPSKKGKSNSYSIETDNNRTNVNNKEATNSEKARSSKRKRKTRKETSKTASKPCNDAAPDNRPNISDKETSDKNPSANSVNTPINPNTSISPKAVFNCTKCSFSTHLRIKLNFHLKNNHLSRNPTM